MVRASFKTFLQNSGTLHRSASAIVAAVVRPQLDKNSSLAPARGSRRGKTHAPKKTGAGQERSACAEIQLPGGGRRSRLLAALERRATYDDRPSAERYASTQGARVQGRVLNVDSPEYRYRLWSVSDNPIRYYLQEWSMVRARRQQDTVEFLSEED